MPDISRSRAEIETLMDKLFIVRNIEKSIPAKIKHEYGNLEAANHGAPPRLIWSYDGGKVLEKVTSIEVTGEPPEKIVRSMGYRRSDYIVRIWMPDLTAAEVVLDQLMTASRLAANPEKYVFESMSYMVPTQLKGKYSELGQVIDAHVGIRTAVPAEPIGTDIDVIVGGWEFRAGIENPVDEPLNESEYDVDRGTGTPPWPA